MLKIVVALLLALVVAGLYVPVDAFVLRRFGKMSWWRIVFALPILVALSVGTLRAAASLPQGFFFSKTMELPPESAAFHAFGLLELLIIGLVRGGAKYAGACCVAFRRLPYSVTLGLIVTQEVQSLITVLLAYWLRSSGVMS